MNRLFSSTSTRSFFFGLMALSFFTPNEVEAVPPAKPTNGVFSYTHIGYPGNNQSQTPSTSWRSWSVSWKDNALDEEGYFVYVRYGNAGPFYLIGAFPANTTNALVSTGVAPVGTEFQARVEPWKYNGKAIEISATLFSARVPARGSKADFAAPSGFAATAVDLDSGTATNLDDGSFQLSWNDNSEAELFHEIRIRESTATNWLTLGRALFSNGGLTQDISYTTRWPHNTSSVIISSEASVQIDTSVTPNRIDLLQLIPGKTYQLQIRPTQSTVSNLDWYPAAPPPPPVTTPPTPPTPPTYPTFTVPTLKAPSQFNVQVSGESQALLTWADNSTNETGFVIEMKVDNEGTTSQYEEVATVGSNRTVVSLQVTQGVPASFRIRAYYEYTVTGASTATKLYSPYADSEPSTGAREFGAPSDLVAVVSGMDHAIDLSWKDNSTTEYGFDVLVRAAGTTGAYRFARAVRSNITSVRVDSMASAVDAVSGRPIASTFEALTKGTAYEFVVRAVGSQVVRDPSGATRIVEASVSGLSNSATATPRAGLTMARLYHPAQVGQAFSYQLSTLNNPARTSWSVTGLPAGLTFASSTGLISGTPTQAGLFRCGLEAVFADGTTARETLTLRVLRALGGPQVVAPLSNTVIGVNTPLVINLAEKFTDGDAESAVRLETTKGNIDILLFPSLAPEGVANFMAYVDSGAYNNMAFHRLEPGFVLQGGLLRTGGSGNVFSSIQQLVASPQNEPGISNIRGTVAAAKVGPRSSSYVSGGVNVDRSDEATFGFHGYLGDPNSATTNFFINLAGNQDNLDNQNGGFTAFGRVTNTGMAVADAIGSLPRGSYSGNQSLNLDGSAFEISGIPMDAATAPTTMDASKTVRVTRAYAVAPLSYSLSDGAATSVVATIENGTQLKLNGVAAGTRSLTVTARDLDGNVVGQTFQVTVTPGQKPPVITRQPVARDVNVGDDVTFSVTATGTDLQYQWRRGGTNLEGKTSATLTLEDVQAGNAGEYDVIVSNATTSLISNRARLSLRTPTDITGITNAADAAVTSLLVEVGAALELKASVVGVPEPVFTWRRGTTAIKGQTTRHLKITEAKLTDGGIYRGTGTNAGGSDSTPAVNVFVIDKQFKQEVHKPGVPITLKAGISGPADQITYQWGKLNSSTLAFEPLPPLSERYTGVEDPALTIVQADLNQDSGLYVCRVGLPDGLGTQQTGVTRVSVANKPILKPMTGIDELPAGFVAVSYRYQVPYETGDPQRPVSFQATGLPPGLKIDAPSGIIFGVPTKSGNYPIRVTAKNPSGTSNPITGVLRISSMQAASTGSFVGLLNASPTLNEDLGGRLDMTVTDTSSFSATLRMGKDSYRAAGRVNFSGQNSDGSVNYRGQVTIPRKNKTSLLLVFVVTSGEGAITGFVTDGSYNSAGLLTGETGQAALTGFRQFYSRSRNPSPSLFVGASHLALDLQAEDVGKAALPQGSGYLKGKSTTSGVVNFSGRLADGTTITSSSLVSQLGNMFVFRTLYGNRGSLLGQISHYWSSNNNEITTNRVTGGLRWYKADTSTATPRSYPTGIAATVLTAFGNYYAAPGTNKIIMGLPNVAGNAYLDFAQGGLGEGVTNPDVHFRITTANKASFTTESNPGQVTLSIDPKTGLYSGGIKLQDGRSAAYRGLVIPKVVELSSGDVKLPPVSSRGAGYFLLPELLPTPTTSKILSGKVTLQPTPVVINPQPQSQEINPDAEVTFTVGVTGGINDPTAPPITYQWYKDGVALSNVTGGSGATTITGVNTNTLVITKAQKANAGSYQCEVSQSVSIVRSESAVLTVRERVTEVILTLQTEGIVNLGDSVTFSTTVTGSAPLTYEWSKNGEILPGITSSSYTIDSVTVADTGTYKVRVRNVLTPDGYESLGVPLNVITPITSVVITRTPSTEFVTAGQEVIFTATANGSSPTYQWRRNNVNIPNAFGRTYTIDSVSNDDGGQYEVYVTNALTPNPVFSEINYLNVAEGISNIEMQKSYPGTGVLPNTTVTYTVTASGENITYQWYKNDVAMPDKTTNSLVVVAGATPTNGSPDIYSVKLFNVVTPSGVLGGAYPLHVALPMTYADISRTPSTATVVEQSGPVLFTVTPDGTGPYTYRWRKNGEIIPEAVSNTYNIAIPLVGDTGTYDCIVTNPLHSGEEAVVTDPLGLTVVPPP